MKSLYQFRLLDELKASDTQVRISQLIGRKNKDGSLKDVEFQKETVVLQNGDGSVFEMAFASASGGMLTFHKRGLNENNPPVEIEHNKKTWGNGTKCYITAGAGDFIDKDEPGVWNGKQTFEGGIIVKGDTTFDSQIDAKKGVKNPTFATKEEASSFFSDSEKVEGLLVNIKGNTYRWNSITKSWEMLGLADINQEKVQENSTKISTLEEKMTTAEGQIEQIQNGGQTNFLAERELGEDIEAGKAYFLGEGILSTRTINDNTAIKSLLPEISESKPPYLAEEKGTEFDDGEFHWKIEEKPSYNNVSYCHFKNDPSSVYRSGANEYDYTGEVTITLSRIDGKEFFLNYFKFKKSRHARPSAKIDGIKSNGESKVLFNGSTNTDDGNEFSSNAGFYQKYSFKIWHGSYAIYFGFAELGIKISHKKTIGVSSPLSIIECKKGDNLKFTINKVGNGDSVNLHGAINKKINSSAEIITHYFKENGYVLIEGVNLGTNTYYTIGELEITRGGEKNKKYKSDSTIDWRNKFLGIEKKGGSKGERTHGIEQGLLKLEAMSDGDCLIGEDGQIIQEGSGVKVGVAVGGYLNILPGKKKIVINKTISGNATAQWTASTSGFILCYWTSQKDSSGDSYAQINGKKLTITYYYSENRGLFFVEKGSVQIMTAYNRGHAPTLTIEEFIPL